MEKKLTAFGVCFRNLRKQKKLNMRAVAERMGVSIAYISAVEYGEREIPNDWLELITTTLSLDIDEKELLKKAIIETPSKKKLSLDFLERYVRNFLLSMAETEEEKEKILELVNQQFRDLREVQKQLKNK